MIQANLIPIPRRMARLRRKRVRRWVTLCAVYSVLLVIAYGALQAVTGHEDEVLEQDVVKISNEISATDKEVKVVTPKLNEARLTLAASMAVGSQPNWSVLLALLAREMQEESLPSRDLMKQALAATGPMLGVPVNLASTGDPLLAEAHKHIVLSSCDLTPVSEVVAATNLNQVKTQSLAQPRYTLSLTGMGRSQAAISRYVLRLEQTGLFNRVTLIESKIAPFAGGEAVSFRIGCLLGEGDGEPR